ncbi:LysR family transcriptional regulator [Halomonas sp. H5]|uniref:LysR family transcriptional regulator n=1 Tax=Halomonas sp. H5 TaxID=3423910 RepID=UPI003D3680CE
MHDLQELHAFATVMEHGSLAPSAQQLGVAKSTLSRRISQLEARLGQPLLRRQANRLIPTEAGLLFHGYCQQILALAEQSQRRLDELREEVSGQVAVRVHQTLARAWLARHMDTFLARHPGIQLTLGHPAQPPTGPDDEAIWIWVGPVAECGLRQETLGRLTQGLYAHPDYLARHGTPSHPRELASHAWVDLLGTTRTGLTLQHPHQGDYHFTPPHSRFRVDQSTLHIDAIARGQGLGVIPHWLAAGREAHHPGELSLCLPDWQPSSLTVSLLYPYGRQSRKVTALLEFLRQQVPPAWRSDGAREAGAPPPSPGSAWRPPLHH